MAVKDEVKEWWTNALLEQQTSAHPVFENIKVKVEGSVVTLRGTVESLEEREEVERQAKSVDAVETVANHLTVVGPPEPYHLQTIIAVYPDADAARLGCQAVASWKLRNEDTPDIVESEDEAQRLLTRRAEAARIPVKGIQKYVDAVKEGKVLLVDRVPEDDALRVISALEGGAAERIQTFPPEPDAIEAG